MYPAFTSTPQAGYTKQRCLSYLLPQIHDHCSSNREHYQPHDDSAARRRTSLAIHAQDLVGGYLRIFALKVDVHFLAMHTAAFGCPYDCLVGALLYPCLAVAAALTLFRTAAQTF